MTSYSASFATWLEQKRGSCTLREFAEVTGVDSGTISRTERGSTEIRLETALYICRSLGLSLSDLFEDWLLRKLPTCAHTPTVGQTAAGALTLQEVECWLASLLSEQQRSRQILIAALNLIALRSGLTSAPPPQLANLFTLRDIDRLLWDLPFVRFEVVPPLHDEHVIETLPGRVYQAGGLLLPLEIGAFARLRRERLGFPLKKFVDQAHLSLMPLLAIENGNIPRLLLGTLLKLDDALGLEGLLVALYWWEAEARLALESSWQAWREAERYTPASLRKTASLLISVGRWLQHIYQDDTAWLRMLRSELGLAAVVAEGGAA